MKIGNGIPVLVFSIIAIISHSTFLDRIAVLLIFILCIIWGRREKTMFNPYYLFAFTPLSLLIYFNVSDNYMVTLTSKTWTLAIINFLAFIFAIRLTGEYKSVKNCTGPANNQLVRHTWIFAILGLVPAIFEVIIGSPFFLASILKLCTVPALVCAIKSKKRVLIITMLILFIGSSMGLLSKSMILQFVLAFLIGVDKFLNERKLSGVKVAALAIIGVIIMIFSFTFANKDRESQSAQETMEYFSYYGNVTWNNSVYLFMPYMYLTTPWANLQYVTETQDVRTYGLWLIRPLLGYAQIDEKLISKNDLNAYSSFNTFSYIAQGFKDFGFWLSIITSIFLGFFVKKVYSRYIKSRSPLDVACYAFTGLAVLEMFFSNVFLKESFPFTIVIIMAIYKSVFFKGQAPQLENK